MVESNNGKEQEIHNYGLDDPWVVQFSREVGPKVRDYVKETYPDAPVTISPLGTGGKYFGLRLKGYLDGEGVITHLVEIDSLDKMKVELLRHKHDIKGSVFIGVDDAIWTARTYNRWKGIMEEIRGELDISDLKYAVFHDTRKIADWYSGNNIPNE